MKYEHMGDDLYRNRSSGVYYERLDLSDPESPIPVPEINIFTNEIGTNDKT